MQIWNQVPWVDEEVYRNHSEEQTRNTAFGFLRVYATPEELVVDGDDDEASVWQSGKWRT